MHPYVDQLLDLRRVSISNLTNMLVILLVSRESVKQKLIQRSLYKETAINIKHVALQTTQKLALAVNAS